jgi:hypothetical protein
MKRQDELCHASFQGRPCAASIPGLWADLWNCAELYFFWTVMPQGASAGRNNSGPVRLHKAFRGADLVLPAEGTALEVASCLYIGNINRNSASITGQIELHCTCAWEKGHISLCKQTSTPDYYYML